MKYAVTIMCSALHKEEVGVLPNKDVFLLSYNFIIIKVANRHVPNNMLRKLAA